MLPNLKHSPLFGMPGIINGRQVGQMILDTASGITQVHQRWVPKEAMTGGNVRVTGVEGTTHTLPMATVRLQVNDCDQEMPVAVSNKLEYDALLGLDVALVRNMIPEGGEEIRQGRPRRICPQAETYAEPSEQGTESEDSGLEEDGEVPSRQENLGEQPTESQVDTSTEDEEETADTTDVLGMVPMTEDMFLHKDDKEKQTRGQKRQERKKYQAIWGQTIPREKEVPSHLGTDNSKRERSTKPSGDRQFQERKKYQAIWGQTIPREKEVPSHLGTDNSKRERSTKPSGDRQFQERKKYQAIWGQTIPREKEVPSHLGTDNSIGWRARTDS